ncbi:MAG: YkgJ family cysteine cluster protein [Desulfobulbaceae bacterium]|jgi:hypothetical protein|nr:YkgJ family cysteine cluster protein [Desulfobulbaceae bacterium]
MNHEERAALIGQIFVCARCGFCCHGETTVSLNEDDQRRMRDFFCLTTAEMREDYWRVTGRETQMRIKDGHCIFYRDGCRAHAARPWRCAQWPLHPAILLDETNFTAIAASCPGIRKNIGYERFRAILVVILDDSPAVSC